MVPILPETGSEARKAPRASTRCSLPQQSGLNRRGNWRFLDRALARKSGTRGFSRHCRQDPSSTAQRTPGISTTTPAFLVRMMVTG